MPNFVVNDIIRLSAKMNTVGLGTIINITGDNTIISWKYEESDSNETTYKTNTVENFQTASYGPIQKKAGDNDWIDKDGNHYNDAGDKQ